MTKALYPAAIFTPTTPTECYGVVFPDLPGCTSAGDSVEHACLMAMDAIEGHLGVMAEYGDPIPPPSTLAQAADILRGDPDTAEFSVLQLIPVTVPGKIVRINLTVDQNLLDRISQVASNRSRFMVDAARAELKRLQAG
jgi:predicted RNase H-like HicB family nuclease